MRTIIELRDVSKTYQMGSVKVDALSRVNMSIKEKEFVSIMGSSGSGKSTLLSLIGTLDRPSSGTIYLGGTDISNLKGDEMARIRGSSIGFIFQFFNLYPSLTARENVELPMVIHEAPKKERIRRSSELLRIVGLMERSDHYPSQLSGGERQRVAIARAMANDPDMILADEPTGNLDSRTSDEIMNIFKKLNDGGKTIVMVTHEADIAKHSKRIIHVKDGIIREGGG